MQALIAIDPGVSGGIAVRDNDGKIKVWKMPETTGDICDFLKSRSIALKDPLVYMEEISGYTKFYGMQVLQRNFGFIQGVVMACDMPLELFKPQFWQSVLNLGKKGKSVSDTDDEKRIKANKAAHDKAWKNKLKEKAQQIFPMVDGITLSTCDALLILRAAEIELREGLSNG